MDSFVFRVEVMSGGKRQPIGENRLGKMPADCHAPMTYTQLRIISPMGYRRDTNFPKQAGAIVC